MHEFEIFSAESTVVAYAVTDINKKIHARLDKLGAGWKVARTDITFNFVKPDEYGEHTLIATVYFERY